MSHRADQSGGYFDLILLLQEAFDLAHRHSLGVHRDDLGIESSKTLLPFADELGFKLSAPISCYFDLQLPLLADQRLFAAAIAVVFPPPRALARRAAYAALPGSLRDRSDLPVAGNPSSALQ